MTLKQGVFNACSHRSSASEAVLSPSGNDALSINGGYVNKASNVFMAI